MEHPFTPKDSDRKICTICDRDYIAHTSAATCENCGSMSKCDIFDNKLLCTNKCFINITAENKKNLDSVTEIVNDVISKARDIDSKMSSGGYFFNAETVSHEDIRKAIEDDNEIPENEKKNRFFNELLRRFTTFQTEIVDIDNQVHKLNLQKQQNIEKQLSISNTIRTYGNEVREEIRNKFKASDTLYAPNPAIKKVTEKKVKSVTTDPFTRMAEMVAAKKNISVAEAKRQLIENGMMPSN